MPTADEIIKSEYTKLITSKYPNQVISWPIISGSNVINGQYGNYIVVIFKDTGQSSMTSISQIQINPSMLGQSTITPQNIPSIKTKIRNDYRLSPRDSVAILCMDCSNLQSELSCLLKEHELTMGVVKMKIFLSHKGCDKNKIRDFKKTLELIGFDPWLDEDAMRAGTQLERGIKNGFRDSCAAIFFVTPNFRDEDYLSSEVDYAIAEKRLKKDQFAIITLVFEENGQKGIVPDLLQSYVWKEPATELEALREIITALPLQIGSVCYR